MRQPAAGRRFYRLVLTSPSSDRDFLPQGRLGGYVLRPNVPPNLRQAILHGVSVFDTESAARAQAAVFRRRTSGSQFRFIAVLDVPSDSDMICDDEFGNEHHWGLYAEPEALFIVRDAGGHRVVGCRHALLPLARGYRQSDRGLRYRSGRAGSRPGRAGFKR